jgi:phosphoglycolate phosphatase-like HAD superfamily hydrolase
VTLKAIVWDLDGTILDSHDAVARTVNRVLQARGHPEAEARQVHAMTGLPIEAIFEAVLPAAELEHTLAYVDEYRVIFRAEVIPTVQPIPGAREAFAEFATLGLPMGVATGRLTDQAEAMLATTKLRHHFQVVSGWDVVTRPKPYPDLLLSVMAALGHIPPEGAVVVGDSAADIAMAHAGGVMVCAVTWGAQTRDQLLEAQPQWCVDTWAELSDLLRSL